MNKNILIYILIGILIVILVGVGLIYVFKWRSNYFAVFLNNGAIYFGKLSTFPKFKLTKVIFLQADQSGQLSIQRFENAFWMPEGPIYLNRDAILFVAPISKSSPLINLIEGKTLPQTAPLPQSSPSSLPQGSPQTQPNQ